ncbi:MAG: hypothetical protein A3F67_01205 [Verrucomicrobia bacterium RIFCSPHIGHO2_12_FULL_41_10]|nr:MAG: hypothetical protein A3F67_01205 [Verrucomicrobia bacterium RIFCSPHIGHO2_12_FULL_41_10]
MNNSLPLIGQLAYNRPPYALGYAPMELLQEETEALYEIVIGFRSQLEECLDEVDTEDGDYTFCLDDEELDRMAILLTELAEDLYADIGFWRTIERHHQKLFGVPLPLICKPGDLLLETFDARRFQFFLYTRWPNFMITEDILSPNHDCFKAIAGLASNYFAKAFAKRPRQSSLKSFLALPYKSDEDMTNKMFWTGQHSFLFRSAFEKYSEEEDLDGEADYKKEACIISNFFLKPCSDCSGLGVCDILASLLDLSEEDRDSVQRWNEPHLSFYQIQSLQKSGSMIKTIEVVNLVNHQLYRIGINKEHKASGFCPGQVVCGSLFSWRNLWHWFFLTNVWKAIPANLSELKQELLQTHRSLYYLYRPDLEIEARRLMEEDFKSFVQFYGSDFMVFTDGLSVAASESKRRREIKLSKELEKSFKKKNIETPKKTIPYDRDFLNYGDEVACFFQEGVGVQMIAGYDIVRSALIKKSIEALTEDELKSLKEIIEADSISPAFAHRLLKEHGTKIITQLYSLSNGTTDIEYLLRRFKGNHYRKQYPRCIFIEEE